MINAPAAPITAEALIGVRIERLARYGEAGVGVVVAVKKEIGAMFSEYASRETKAVVAPIREAIHAQARAAVAEILETLDYARPSDEEN